MEWKSDKEIEEEKARIEEEKVKKEEERQKRIKEIKESTDPSMEEMGQMTWTVSDKYDETEYSIRITRREAMLIEEDDLDKNEIYRKQQKEKRQKRIKEVEESTDPSMEEIIVFESDYTELGSDPEFFSITKRDELLFRLR